MLPPPARVTRALTACGLALLVFTASGCSAATHSAGAGTGADAATTPLDMTSGAVPTAAKRAAFPSGARFDYQLGGAYTPGSGVELVERDRTAKSAKGVYSVCYVNAFQTQPGEKKTWPTSVLLKKGKKLVKDPDWPNEYLLDTSTKEKRATIAKTVRPWLRSCAQAGFKGVEFDNLDSFTRSEGKLEYKHNRALATTLVEAAHSACLAAGQKNSAEYATKLKSSAKFDFAVAEECAAYNECADYSRAYGTNVVDVEYTDNLPRDFATMCKDKTTPRATILRDRDLVKRGEKGYVYESCR